MEEGGQDGGGDNIFYRGDHRRLGGGRTGAHKTDTKVEMGVMYIDRSMISEFYLSNSQKNGT